MYAGGTFFLRERWWFVTPEGHAWLGFGINHVHPAWLNQSYNRDVWLKRFGAAKFDDEAWQAGMRARVKADMAVCGYNHFGVHNVFGRISGLTTEAGANTSVRLASGITEDEPSGSYYSDGVATPPSSAARDAAARQQLWDVSIGLAKV